MEALSVRTPRRSCGSGGDGSIAPTVIVNREARPAQIGWSRRSLKGGGDGSIQQRRLVAPLPRERRGWKLDDHFTSTIT